MIATGTHTRHRAFAKRMHARTHARTYVRTFTQRETQTHAPTYAHVRSLNAALGSSVEATNTLQRINRITAPPSIRSPPFCHDDMYVCITRVSLRNNAALRRSSWTATASRSSPARTTKREARKRTPKYKINREHPSVPDTSLRK